MKKRINVSLRLPTDVLAYFAEVSSLAGETIEACINVVLSMQLINAKRELQDLKREVQKKAAKPKGRRG